MSVYGFVLVLTAAFCHATWNFFVKRINGGPELVWLFSFISVLIYLPVAGWIFFSQEIAFGLWAILFIAGSAALHLGYFLLLQIGYSKGDLSLVYPTARAIGPILSTGFAMLFLGESMTPRIAVGAIAVIVGVACLTGGFRKGATNLTASLAFGIAAGGVIGTYTVWDAYAVSALAVAPLLLDYASSLGRTVLLAPVAIKRAALVKRHWRDHRVGVIAIAVFNPLAYILVLYALTFTPVIYVAPTREVSVVLTVLAGSVLLGEGHLRRRLAWAMVILCGVTLLVSA